MKSKTLLITTIIFFLLINTSYFWERKIGALVIPVFFIIILVYYVLWVVALRQFYLMRKEKFKSRRRNLLFVFLVTILLLTYFNPKGIIHFDKDEDILIAQREGAANCATTLKLKKNKTFIETNICFGLDEITGKYFLRNDTIFFTDVDTGRDKDPYFQFARIVPTVFGNDVHLYDLMRYKNADDSLSGAWLRIVKNDLKAND